MIFARGMRAERRIVQHAYHQMIMMMVTPVLLLLAAAAFTHSFEEFHVVYDRAHWQRQCRRDILT